VKSASPTLIALLSSARQFWMADLYTFTLVDTTVLRYTSADIDITTGGNTFSHNGPIISRSRTRVALGTAVDQLDLNITATAETLLSGLPWLQAITNGALDGAEVKLERAFAASPEDAIAGNIAGTVNLFEGRVSETTTDSLTSKVIVRSWLELLNTPLPHNLYQPPCGNSLYDTGCGVSRAAYAAFGAVASGSTRQSINCGLGNPAGYFDIGEIVMTSGQNLGVIRTVRSYAPGVVALAYPLPKPVSVGDTFTIYPGCDKRLTTCDTKFGNKPRFRGTPFVPVPETAL
jgi:uncharacterized phage protein (TIGR02218 family)